MITKEKIVKAAAHDLGLPLTTVGPVFDRILANIVQQLDKGETVQFRNFGTFTPKKIKARTYKIPATGEMMEVSERPTIKFVASDALRYVLDPEAPTALMQHRPPKGNPYMKDATSVFNWRDKRI